MLTAIFNRDFPVVQGVTLVFALMVITVNLLTDVFLRPGRSPREVRLMASAADVLVPAAEARAERGPPALVPPAHPR